MENNKKENLKDKIEEFINERKNKLKKENDFIDEICEVHEFKDLSEVEEVHNLELELNEIENTEYDEMEEIIKEIADDIKIIDDMIKISCKINNDSRLLLDTVNCNIKPIPLLNIALITNLNIKIIDIEINDYMMTVMDIVLLVTMTNEDNQRILLKTDVDTLYRLGLITAVDSLLDEVELSPVEFRGIVTLSNMEDINQVLKFSNNIE